MKMKASYILFLLWILAMMMPAMVLGALGDCPNFGDTIDYNDLGLNGALPAFGRMTFSLGSCELNDEELSSFVYLNRDGGEFYWFNFYYNEDGDCDDLNKFCYINYRDDDSLHGQLTSTRVASIDRHCTCAGSHSSMFGQDSRQEDNYCFSKAHVLCNDGNIVSIVSQSTKNPDKYFLFYSAKTVNTDLNEKSGYNQMSQDYMKVTDGKYCDANMFRTVTYLQSDLKDDDSFGWQCKDSQDETCSEDYDYGTCPVPDLTPPTPSNCTGSADPCSTQYDMCGYLQDLSCAKAMELCEGEATCGLQQGCQCEEGITGLAGTRLNCNGNAIKCEEISDEASCYEQSGCTFQGASPPPCTGEAEPCSTQYWGTCSEPVGECDGRMQLCESESTCGAQQGCDCYKDFALSASVSTIWCVGTAVECERIRDEASCNGQAGCTFQGATNLTPTSPPVTDPPATPQVTTMPDPPVTDPSSTPTGPPTDPPGTDPPMTATDSPVTDPPPTVPTVPPTDPPSAPSAPTTESIPEPSTATTPVLTTAPTPTRTSPPMTGPPTTDPPATDPPATDPPATDPLPATNTCTGNVARCGSYSSRSDCNAISGCSYQLTYCYNGICQYEGCYGSPKPCSDFDGNEDGCLNQAGCEWNGNVRGSMFDGSGASGSMLNTMKIGTIVGAAVAVQFAI